uniref:Uncharacterized protein n=1 Tax=viral metagenome TaxID=1070528 RepID=A0A6C0BEI2_9ZZZZ
MGSSYTKPEVNQNDTEGVALDGLSTVATGADVDGDGPTDPTPEKNSNLYTLNGTADRLNTSNNNGITDTVVVGLSAPVKNSALLNTVSLPKANVTGFPGGGLISQL